MKLTEKSKAKVAKLIAKKLEGLPGSIVVYDPFEKLELRARRALMVVNQSTGMAEPYTQFAAIDFEDVHRMDEAQVAERLAATLGSDGQKLEAFAWKLHGWVGEPPMTMVRK